MTRLLRSWTRPGLVLLLAGLAPALASAEPVAGLLISDPWMRVLNRGSPAAGYFTLSNGLDHSVRLLGAASPACGSLTLHQTLLRHTMSAMSAMDPGNPRDGGPMASMRPVPGVAVPAHGMIRFAPGGYHLMCDHPGGDVAPGRTIPVTLLLEGGGTLAADFPARGPRGE